MFMIKNVDVKSGSGSEVGKRHGIRWSNRCPSHKHPSEHSNRPSENASWPLRSRNDSEELCSNVKVTLTQILLSLVCVLIT